MTETTNNLLGKIWAEKYRPTTLDQCLLDSKLKTRLASIKKLNHLILYGDYGMGKTSVARILAEKFSPEDTLEINAADENGIDTVRTKIHDFMQFQSYSSEHKVVILNEASYLTKQAQEALRSPLEEYSETCRFIFTANDILAMDDAIKSRCQTYEFTPAPMVEYAKHIKVIAEKESIPLTKEDNPNIVKLVRAYYPDLRKTINEFEKTCMTGAFIWDQSDNWMEELYLKIHDRQPHKEIREWFIKNHFTRALNFVEIYQFLFRKFIDNDKAVLLIAEFLDKKVIDVEINFAAFLIRMERILADGK